MISDCSLCSKGSKNIPLASIKFCSWFRYFHAMWYYLWRTGHVLMNWSKTEKCISQMFKNIKCIKLVIWFFFLVFLVVWDFFFFWWCVVLFFFVFLPLYFFSWIIWRISVLGPEKELHLQQVLMNLNEENSFSLDVELLQNN